jgi:MoaA/NifB/PqqE/SkfB family radical SAM enzyme
VLQIHPSLRCNLSCLHCYSSSSPDGLEGLDPGLLQRLVEEASDLEYSVLGVSGGEPLLYPGLPDVLRHARQRGMTTTVTTNGVLLTESRLRELQGLVDVLAISLDGIPASHARMRGDDQAFARMAARLPALAASGVTFGFVFTLTQANVHELEWVVDFATGAGASLVQVHPLEAEGNARQGLTSLAPDGQELAFALLESLRLQSTTSAFLQLDVTSAADLLHHPERFLCLESVPDQPLGRWLTPLVLEADGTLVPITYGFPRAYALGNLHNASLGGLLRHWNPEPLLALARRTREQALESLRASDRSLLNWYQEIVDSARP